MPTSPNLKSLGILFGDWANAHLKLICCAILTLFIQEFSGYGRMVMVAAFETEFLKWNYGKMKFETNEIKNWNKNKRLLLLFSLELKFSSWKTRVHFS